MHALFRLIATLTSFAVCVRAGIPGYTQVKGVTRLLGSSFGVPGINLTFDYVIIGGGTAGLTVATRLAENPDLTVAVIEGGGFYELENGNVSQIPAYGVEYSSPDPSSIQPTVDWGIVTAPQTARLLISVSEQQLGGRQIHYTQGKCLGGSSGRNYLAYHRGSAGAYQRWADMVGDQSFTFPNLLPFFQKSPHLTPPNYAKRGAGSEIAFDPSAFKPSGGPLQVSYANFYQPFSPFIKRAFETLGLKNINGLSSGVLEGFSEFTVTVDPHSATRSSSETSFLQQALSRTNLQVYQRTLAKKVNIENKTATSVTVDTAGKTYYLSAAKEVILSAGAFRSPQMLMVSGIGPKTTLEQHGIAKQVDAPGVGQGMWDQPFFSTNYRVNVTTNSQLEVSPAASVQATLDYLTNQTGPLVSSASNWVGWEKLPYSLRRALSNTTLAALSTFPPDWPELELLPLAANAAPSVDTDNYATFSVAVLTPTSRGNVTVASADSGDNPIVSPNWLMESADQELAVQALKRIREVAQASEITVGSEVVPGANVTSDAQLLAFIKETLAPIYHAVATCSMGSKNDSNAVVDTKGRVYGVQRLRIVDASIFPLLPPGHPQATVYGVAEKIASDILNG